MSHGIASLTYAIDGRQKACDVSKEILLSICALKRIQSRSFRLLLFYFLQTTSLLTKRAVSGGKNT